MSDLQAVTEVADQLIKRIFDQRKFTADHSQSLHQTYTSFENERIDKLISANQNVCLISDSINNDLAKVSAETGQSISDKVNELQEKTEKLLNLEEKHKSKTDTLLYQVREERAKIKNDCDADIKGRLEKLDQSLLKEEEELDIKYKKFEEKLR